CDMQRKVELPRGMDPARQHIVGIAAPGDRASLDGAFVFLERQNVRHHLTGMRPLRQSIDDRHTGVAGKFEHGGMIENANHDRVDETRQDARGIGDGLAAAELHFLAGQHDCFAAEFAHRDVEGDSRAGRGFVENHRQNLAGEGPVRRALSLAAACLDALRGVENPPQVGSRNLRKIEEMPPGGGGCALAFNRVHTAIPPGFAAMASSFWPSSRRQAASKRAMASAFSASPMMSGGNSRATFSAAGMTRIRSARAAAAKSLTGTRKAMPRSNPSPRIP